MAQNDLELFNQDDCLTMQDILVAGVDEAWRGPLAGAVYAAAVILNPDYPIVGLTDSKKLSEKKRQALFPEIQEKALAWCIASASVEEIDRLNILQATMLAMSRAVEGLLVQPNLVLIDGNRVPAQIHVPAKAIIKGDLTEAAISAASILAKTARDAELLRLHDKYPEYAFDQHKGYGTALHLACLKAFGPCSEDRQSFAPVRRCMLESSHKV